jgi:predicted dehydrogenase
MINNKIVLGYIGNGKSTNRYHLPFVLQRKDKFIVKTIYNPHIHHDVWDKIEGINYTENQDDIFLDDEIDMVVVCTAHHYHYEYTKKALEHNKHCLCEKPFMENSKLKKSLHLRKKKDFIVLLIKIEDMIVIF